MASFNDLIPTSYYLIQENENSRIELVYVLMSTEKCVLIEYQDEEQTLAWFKKSDAIFEIVEQLSDEQALIFESIFDGEEEEEVDDLPWDNMEDDINTWFGDDDDLDTDEKKRALNN